MSFPGLVSDASANSRDLWKIAHRGASGYAPENTIAAFDLALKMNADLIEFDVQRSKDGKLVVIHDETVDRTTDGSGAVMDLTLEELRGLDAGSWFSDAYAGERIPTLGEVLDRYRGQIGFLIEIKSPWLYPGIEQQVADELRERVMDEPKRGEVIVQSFDHAAMRRFHALLPDIPIGLLTFLPEDLTEDKLRDFAEFAEYVNPHLSLASGTLTDQIHSLGMKILPWTVRDKSQVEPLIRMGVDGIITDYPDYVPRKDYG
ncbi:glycerophosphodiester phosphodiesterase [Cohnella sp. CFH 77786]|uniref:glycerophosphodiester phosphodiesterase n=1 Tax=Cohnella sp. CFH 77786 TaxID=2662265 RepID=UPI00351D4144